MYAQIVTQCAPRFPKIVDTHFPNLSTFRARSHRRLSSRAPPLHHVATRSPTVVDLHPPDIQPHPCAHHHLSHRLSHSCASVSHRVASHPQPCPHPTKHVSPSSRLPLTTDNLCRLNAGQQQRHQLQVPLQHQCHPQPRHR